MAHDPLSPAEALRTPVGTVVAIVALLTLVYSVVIVAQILLGVIVGIVLPFGLYLGYRTFAALDAIADAAQRIAAVREREAEHEAASTDRLTERER